MTHAVVRGRRLEPDARREQILVCAVRLFGERPYAEVSTTDIAREAGVARGLLNHYFGTKRDLYLTVVRRLVRLPHDPPVPGVDEASVEERVAASVESFLDAMGDHGAAFVAVIGAEGVGDDPEVERILAEADDAAAAAVLAVLGLPARDERLLAVVRCYGGLVKATVREWVTRGTLTRVDAHDLMAGALLAVVRDVLPRLDATTDESATPTRECQ